MTIRTLFLAVLVANGFCGCERRSTLPASAGASKLPVRWPGPSSQAGSCELHGTVRIQDTAPILYGQMFIDRATTNFPKAWSFVGAGCTVTADSPTQAVVYFCPTCRAAEQKWKGQHDK